MRPVCNKSGMYHLYGLKVAPAKSREVDGWRQLKKLTVKGHSPCGKYVDIWTRKLWLSDIDLVNFGSHFMPKYMSGNVEQLVNIAGDDRMHLSERLCISSCRQTILYIPPEATKGNNL
jgi:hypothetical protein